MSELQPEIDKIYQSGIVKGAYIGFQSLANLYSIKLGCTTYVMGSPYSGKTEFWFEILINLSVFYGWKHVIFTPETGSKEEVAAELLSKCLKKPFYNYNGRMTESEKYKELAWLDEHFYIIDPSDNSLTPEDFFKTVDEIEKTYKVKINTTTLDPYNELKHEIKDTRQDLYIEELLGLVRRNARAKNRHNCIITHAADQQPITQDGITYYPAPTPRQYAGGQAWFRKGMGMLAVWRPPSGLRSADGTEYQKNEVHIIVQKSKPKGVGERGTAVLYFDLYKNRYYELLDGITPSYAKEQEKASQIESKQPNLAIKNYYENENETPF